jgi:hypothetical protein
MAIRSAQLAMVFIAPCFTHTGKANREPRYNSDWMPGTIAFRKCAIQNLSNEPPPDSP